MKKIGFLLLVFYAFQTQAGVTENEFHQVLDKVHALYQPDVEALGKSLTIQKEWENETVNAYAAHWPDRYIVTILGGIAKHERTIPDSLAAIACHEMGHLFGGEPYRVAPADWSSVEPQADYYATAKCMKRYLADEDNIGFLRDKEVPATVTSKCSTVYASEEDRALCARSALAGIAMANLLADLNQVTVDIDTPSQEEAGGQLSVQCRLDTYFAGSLCDVTATDQNYCAQGTLGGRPRCWYKPNH